MKPTQPYFRYVQTVLAFIGSLTVLLAAGYAALHLASKRAPDSLTELISPDRRYRLVITEEIAGFPGAVCTKQVHVVASRAAFDRNDKDSQVFSGGCDGLASIAWNGKQVQGTVALAAALDGAQALELKGSAAGGQVQLSWTER